MLSIGITGGVGSGKSKILSYLKENYNCKILMSDDIAKDLCKRGQVCFEPLLCLLGADIVGSDGEIDRGKMAQAIFNDNSLLSKVNGIIHPAVKTFIINTIEKERTEGSIDFLFIEAALLIECGFKTILDELWYIYCDVDVRRERLKESRGYSDSKIDSILNNQLSVEEYRKNTDFVIDNSGDISITFNQISKRMKSYGYDAE